MVNLIWMLALLFIMVFCALCAVMAYCRKLADRYIKLEEWAESWLKRLEIRVESCEVKQGQTDKLLPKDGNGEVIRNQILLQQMNDEMERGLQMEKQWNDGLASILNYGKPITEVNKNE